MRNWKCCCIAALLSMGIMWMPNRTVADVPEVFPTEAVSFDETKPAPASSAHYFKVPSMTQPTLNPDDGAPRGPGSDNCAGATAAIDGINSFDTTAATTDGPTHTSGECQYAGPIHRNVWFTYTTTCAGFLTVSTCGDLGGASTYDTRLAVYSGTCGSPTLLGCNDDDGGNPCGQAAPWQSTVEIPVSLGQNLLISVGGFGDTDTGVGSLFIGCVAGDTSGACCAPAGTCTDVADEFACDATGGVFQGPGTLCATTNCPLPNGACCTDGVCTDEPDEASCLALGGNFQGTGSECATTECPCGNAGYLNNFAGNGGFVTIPTGFSLGNGIALAGTDRAICQIELLTRNIQAPVGTPYDIELLIYDACPSPQSPPVGACGSTANLLYSSLMDAPLLSVASTADPAEIGTWTLPNLPVRTNIWLMFRAINPSTHAFVDDTGPSVGIRSTSAALCYSGNSGCGWQFGTGLVNFAFAVYTRPIAEAGACCDFSDGTCNNVATQTACEGATETYTYSGFGGDCNNPTQGFSCVALIGACCNIAGQTCTDGALPSNCAAAGLRFSLGRTCANVTCPLTCSDVGEGQVANYGGNGTAGSAARTADLSLNFAGFMVADNFSPEASGTLTSIRWWGVYRNFLAGNVPCTPSNGDVPDNFRVTIWNDALGIPFQIVGGPLAIGATATKVDTGFDLPVGNGPRRVYQYTISGLNIPLTAELCYWVEVSNDTTGGECQWQWLSGPLGDDKAIQHLSPTVPPAWDASEIIAHDMAMCVSVDIKPDGCINAIELPGACCIPDAPLCASLTPSDCANAGGTFTITGEPCPSPVNSTPLCKGACCVGDSCIIVIQNECNGQSGTWFGVGSDCDPDPCNGACCLSDGSCIDVGLNRLSCEDLSPNGLSGSWSGGATCATVTCATFDQCDLDGVGTLNGMPLLACNSSTVINNRSQASDEADGQGPVFPDNPDPSCYGGNGQGDGEGNFWVAFTGTGQSVEISTCDSEVSDTVLAVYTYGAGQSCATGLLTLADELACSEDDATCSDGLQSKVCLATTTLGQTYYVQVSSFGAGDVGNFLINITCPCPAVCACPGDTSGDGILDGRDVQSFANCLVNGGAGCECADSDGDAAADDEFGATGDIADFVSKLLSGAVCP